MEESVGGLKSSFQKVRHTTVQHCVSVVPSSMTSCPAAMETRLAFEVVMIRMRQAASLHRNPGVRRVILAEDGSQEVVESP